LKLTEIAAYFKRFDEAEKLYLEADRKWETKMPFSWTWTTMVSSNDWTSREPL
jgi:hypothetical protein